MEEKSYTSTHPLGHTGQVTGSLYLYYPVPLARYYKCSLKLFTEIILKFFPCTSCINCLCNNSLWNIDFFSPISAICNIIFLVMSTRCSINVEDKKNWINPLKLKDPYSGRSATLTSKICILYIYSTDTGTEYFKHGIHGPFFPIQNAVCFIILTYSVPVLFT